MARARAAHLRPAELVLARRHLDVGLDQIEGPPVGMLVGEMPSASSAGALPLFPWPKNSSGGRLMKLSGLSPGAFLGRFLRRNLHPIFSEYDAAADRRAAEFVRTFAFDEAIDHVVLLGERVARAFQMEVWSSGSWLVQGRPPVSVATIAHPSGRALVYQDARYRAGAQAALLRAAGKLDG